ncbi:hypothetical protein CXB51_001168 [Gossypium anomalum]|uniref:SMP-30/Gluconolactonase/LRE-like region domain-containing protein n=1 Tax=Gossypium anomalum TaxID=47600 RepID=A0A8J5ZIA4_9ROSI|nr:hypothetical protein CXB51_001168 [Gossypium anomalum]
MASFKVLFCLSLYVLFLVSSSGTRLFHPFSIADPALKMESKSQYKANTHDEEITYRHFESKQFLGIDQLALAVADKQHPEAAIIESRLQGDLILIIINYHEFCFSSPSPPVIGGPANSFSGGVENFKYQLLFLMLYLALHVKQFHQRILYQKHDVLKVSHLIDCKGEGPYIGVSYGRILKWHGPKFSWKEFSTPSSIRKRELSDGSTNPNLEPICGRPLGLKFNPELSILQIVVLLFKEGMWIFCPDQLIIAEGLMFPNGVALNKNHSFLLVAETTQRRILKFNLGTNNFEPEVFAELPRVPDNMKMNDKGEFWVALNTRRIGEIDDDVPDPIGIKYDQEGRILKQLDGNGKGVFSSVSEINEVNQTLYIGSVTKPYVLLNGWIFYWIRKRELCDGSTNPNLESICERPLCFSLLMIGPNGIPFKFINGLDINSSTRVIYFIDSNFLSRSTDSSGRLLKYYLDIKKSIRYIHKFDVSKRRSFEQKSFFSFGGRNNMKKNIELPRVPNNIKMNHKGEFWIALNAGRLGEINYDVLDPIGIKYDQEGIILKQLDENSKNVFSSISEINEVNRTLYIGSVTKPYIQPKILICNEKHLETAIIESKRALIEEDREAIKASIERNGGISYETKRRSPGEPDPVVIPIDHEEISAFVPNALPCIKILYQKNDVEKIDERFLDQKQNVATSKDYELINLVKVIDSESIAFDCKGEGPYVKESDGTKCNRNKDTGNGLLALNGQSEPFHFDILNSLIRNESIGYLNGMDQNLVGKSLLFLRQLDGFFYWIRKRELCDGSTNPNLEPICGRPLDLKFNPITCDLYISDAYFGLLKVGPSGAIAQTLVSSVEGITFRFISRGLMFPNRIALSKNHSFLLGAETTRRRILKFNIGTNNLEPKVFAELPRVPDNIKMNHKGELWVALNIGRLGEINDDVLDPI